MLIIFLMFIFSKECVPMRKKNQYPLETILTPPPTTTQTIPTTTTYQTDPQNTTEHITARFISTTHMTPTLQTNLTANITMADNLLTVRRGRTHDYYTTSDCYQCECREKHFYAIDLHLKNACYDWKQLRLGFYNRLVYFIGNESTVSVFKDVVTNGYVGFPYETPEKCFVKVSYEARYNYWLMLSQSQLEIKLLFDPYADSYILKQNERIEPGLRGSLVRIDIACGNGEIYFLLVRFIGQKDYMFNDSFVAANIPEFLNSSSSNLSVSSSTSTPGIISHEPENSGLSLDQKVNAIVGASAGLIVAIATCFGMIIFRYWKLYKRARQEKRISKKMNNNNIYETGVNETKQRTILKYNPPLPPTPNKRPALKPLQLEPRWPDYVSQHDTCGNDSSEKYDDNIIYDDVQGNIYQGLHELNLGDYSPLEKKSQTSTKTVSFQSEPTYVDSI